MSGHSKWSTIKRQKGTNDAKRGQAFTKLANAISVSVREGGGIGDPAQNFKLRLLTEKARAINMPKENITRAIERGEGKGGEGVHLAEVVYEGFGPEKVAVMVEAMTDNKARTTSLVKNIFDKNGGILGQSGTVGYQFVSMGEIIVPRTGHTLDELFLLAADAGATDVRDGEEENTVMIYTQPADVAKVRDALIEKNIKVNSAELTRLPTMPVAIEEDSAIERIQAFIEKLEDLDDVQKVFVNIDTGNKLS